MGRLEAVRETMYIGRNSPSFVYTLTTHLENTPLVVAYQNHEIIVSLPATVAQQWAGTDQVGIELDLPAEDGQSLHVLIEKDFQCLHREEEEEPDQFPNPAAASGSV